MAAFLKNLLTRHHFNSKTLNSFNSSFPLRPITSLPQTIQPPNSQTQQDGEGNIDTKKKPKRMSLYSLFTDEPAPDHSVISTQNVVEKKQNKKEPFVAKELSVDMVMFLKHLYQNGYFKDAKFSKFSTRFQLVWFNKQYALGYAKFAAMKFATDNPQIAEWLSGSALKQVAVFGCPFIGRNGVFPAKRLRKCLEVPENTVCSKCMLRESCKFVNENVSGCDKLDLNDVMKVIIPYALHWMDPQLVVSDELNKSVNHLLNEFVKLSQSPETASISTFSRISSGN
ncbi:hypothetical protein MtrunA17_Chr2g0315221 [Medicago truncatula]|uniref:Uncharacterized protein n=1 Tax=Medicago truncatula TaxID=3880 RepID=G7IR09_MEDTR|nr:uncharacterized protein LOC11409278 [Medicago truncatula]AES66530.1 hypothetical protein MTR_2g075450 [Medicago truncatula]RHN74889.1 hypothetical protein MtrunA17_Chr2g0315221 [Medicago truncatula]